VATANNGHAAQLYPGAASSETGIDADNSDVAATTDNARRPPCGGTAMSPYARPSRERLTYKLLLPLPPPPLLLSDGVNMGSTAGDGVGPCSRRGCRWASGAGGRGGRGRGCIVLTDRNPCAMGDAAPPHVALTRNEPEGERSRPSGVPVTRSAGQSRFRATPPRTGRPTRRPACQLALQRERFG